MIPVLGGGGEIHTSPGALITATAAALVFSLVDGCLSNRDNIARTYGNFGGRRMMIMIMIMI